MKITLTIDDVVYQARLPYEEAAFVLVDDIEKCPFCEHKNGEVLGVKMKFKVHGRHKRIESHDTYASDAHALCCGKQVGTLRVKMNTVFGVEEDERVLSGPWKVY